MYPQLAHVLAQLEAQADPERAKGMAAYMKHRFSYFGVQAPVRNAIQRSVLQAHPLPGKLVPWDLVEAMWEHPHREVQYVAIDWLIRFRKQAPEGYLAAYETLLIQKAWWDSVDMIASNLMGHELKQDAILAQNKAWEWMHSDHLWLQRTALLFQLKYKHLTDWDLLQALIHHCKGSEEFFLRKAIGWALREYSKQKPTIVAAFIAATELSGLSIREGMKWIKKNRS
ncbi:MAG: DNA alkylation repair protein [Bacteroidota bacterium]